MDCLLNESLDISTVLDNALLYKNWLATDDKSLALDASQVERVDAAGIQTLASLFITAQHNQLIISLNNPSKVLSEGITILGLQKIFDAEDKVKEGRE